MQRFTFSKEERLCSKRVISELYRSHDRVLVFPLSIHWQVYPGETFSPAVQVVIVAPKKKLRFAVSRNRAKRLIRECYRKNKHTLQSVSKSKGISLALSINYIHNEVVSYGQVERAVAKAFAHMEGALATMKVPSGTSNAVQ